MGIERFYIPLTRLRAPLADGRHGEFRDWANAVETSTGLCGRVWFLNGKDIADRSREGVTVNARCALPIDDEWLDTDRLRVVRNGRTYTFDFVGSIDPKGGTTEHHLEADLVTVEG